MALEKLLRDITEEKQLWTLENTDSKPDAQEAWARVGKRNNLTALEARTTFKILLKRYKQEVLKPKSSWRLFEFFKSLGKEEEKKKMEVLLKTSPPPPQEEETYVELLEVKDEEFSDEESSSKENRSSFGSVAVKNEPDGVLPAVTSSPTPSEDKNSTGAGAVLSNKRKIGDVELSENGEAPPEKRMQTEATNEERQSGDGNQLNDKQRAGETPSSSIDLINNIQSSIRTKSAGTEYSSFGSYVASTLNKLPAREAAKLEVRLLQAIIDIKSEMLE